MSKSVVPAAAVAHAKRLVSNKKLAKQHEAQQPAKDEQQAVVHKDEAANVVHHDAAQPQQLSMSDATLGGFSFAGALADAASATASLTVATSAQDEAGYSDDDSDGSGTILLVGAVALVGAGIAVLAGGGGKGNEAPTISSGGTASVAENSAVTTVVYTTAATDPDGDALTYSLTGADAAAFNISNAGVVTFKASPDFETKSTYNINVVASDGELTATKAVVVSVTNVNEAPVFTSGATASVAENSATTTVVYDAAVTGAGATFALTGADADAFNIDPATGVVTFKASPDFEAQSSYAIGVVATQDGMTTTQNVAVTVTDVVEPGPTFTSGGTATALPENSPTSTVIYDAEATGSGTIVFALTGDDAALFNIDAATGVVTLKAPADFETKESYAFNVTATDVNGTSSQAVTLAITDVDPEGPVVTEVALDGIPGMTVNVAATLDASGGPVVYTDDATQNTNVIIKGFGEDDIIEISGIPSLDTLSYTTNGGDGGANDLRIDWQNTTTGTVEFIIIEDAVVNPGGIFNYATAMNAVGFDFMTIA